MIYLVSNQKSIESPFELKSIKESIEYLYSIEEISLDTETTGFNPHQDKILSMQLGDKNTQFYIDNTIDFSLYKEVLENKLLIAQNAQFDWRFLYKIGIYPLKIWDTYIAEICLSLGYSYYPKDLASLGDKYIGTGLHTIDKSKRGDVHKFGILSTQAIKYGCADIEYLSEIKEKQVDLANHLGILESIIRECNFTPSLAYVAYCGIYLDKNKWTKKVQDARHKLEVARDKLNSWYINNNTLIKVDKTGQLDLFSDQLCGINWSSSDQVIPILEGEGVDVWTIERGERKKTTSEKHLKKFKGKFEIVDLLLEYKTWQTDISKYGDKFLRFIDKNTGRIHTTFTQVLSTGRISSGKRKKGKTDEEEYPNLQNIPSDDRTRGCFVPQKNNSNIIDCDYSAQEDIVFVNNSKEKKLIEFYNSDFADGHSYVAKLCFPDELEDVSMEDVKEKAPKLRFHAKSAKFAIHYGGDAYTISNNLGLPLSEGERIFNAYLKAFPDIAEYFDKKEEESLENGYITISTVTGRKYFLFEITKDLLGYNPKYFKSFKDWKEGSKGLTREFWTKYKEEKRLNSVWFKEKKDKVREFFKIKSAIRKLSLNYPIQGQSGEITKLAATNLFKWIVENKYFGILLLINIVHDELMGESPEYLSKLYAEKIQFFMEDAAKEYCPIISLKAKPVITSKWEH